MADTDRAPGGEVGGSYRYTGPGLGRFGLWKCPRCGVENAGEFERGCSACGPVPQARHVGVEKPKSTPAPAPISWPRGDDPLVQRFRTWAKGIMADPDLRPTLDLGVDQLLWIGFRAGWNGRERTADDMASQLPEPAPSPDPPDLPFPVEGKAARTLAAALALFLENVLAHAEEEVANGEWCSLDEAQALLDQLKQKGDLDHE